MKDSISGGACNRFDPDVDLELPDDGYFGRDWAGRALSFSDLDPSVIDQASRQGPRLSRPHIGFTIFSSASFLCLMAEP